MHYRILLQFDFRRDVREVVTQIELLQVHEH